MASALEVQQVTGVPIGAVPPFGNIFAIPLYMDTSLQSNETIVFNAGLHTKSISLKEVDFEKIAKPMIGEFSQTHEVA